MTVKFPPSDETDRHSQAYADAILVAISAVSDALEKRGELLSLNALIGGIVGVVAFHIAGVEEAHARKALLRALEKELPRAVARQRTQEGGVNRGRVVIVEKGTLN